MSVEYTKILTKGTESTLPVNYNDGKLRFTEDTQRLFLDLENDRVEFSDFIKGLNESTIRGIDQPKPKIYLSSDTRKLLFYDSSQWKEVTVTIPNASTSSVGGIQLDGDSSHYLKGDGTWGAGGGGGSTYDRATTASDGLLRQLDGDTSHFINGMGEWATPPNTTYSNATSTSAGLIQLDGSNSKYLDGSGNWTTPPNTTYSTATSENAGLLPALDGSNTKYLNGNGGWSTPPDTTYSNATSTSAGLIQLDGSENKYLDGSGQWSTPPSTTYANATTESAGLLPILDGSNSKYLDGSGNWTTPPNTTYSNATSTSAGLIQLDGSNSKYLAGDGNWSTPPNTTYANATSTTAGLIKLDGDSGKYLAGDGSWIAPSIQDLSIYYSETDNSFPIVCINNQSTVTVSDRCYRNNNVSINPNTGQLNCTYINGTPATGVDFDFGFINSSTSEIYNN